MKLLGLHDSIETERYILKTPEESEAEYMWNIITEDTIRYMIWEKGDSYETTLIHIIDTRKKAFEGDSWDSAIYDKSTQKLVGRCGINKIDIETKSFEIGYWVAEKYYGQGIVPECVKRFLQFAFEESEFEKVIIRCDNENVNSARVAEKSGLKLEGVFKKHELIKGELRDTKYFGITREDYFAK